MGDGSRISTRHENRKTGMSEGHSHNIQFETASAGLTVKEVILWEYRTGDIIVNAVLRITYSDNSVDYGYTTEVEYEQYRAPDGPFKAGYYRFQTWTLETEFWTDWYYISQGDIWIRGEKNPGGSAH